MRQWSIVQCRDKLCLNLQISQADKAFKCHRCGKATTITYKRGKTLNTVRIKEFKDQYKAESYLKQLKELRTTNPKELHNIKFTGVIK